MRTEAVLFEQGLQMRKQSARAQCTVGNVGNGYMETDQHVDEMNIRIGVFLYKKCPY